MNDALHIAQTLLLPNGISPLPIYRHSKRATVKWGQWQADGIPAAQLPLLFRDDNLTVAGICGSASQNLLVLDCDTRDAFDHYRNALGDPETWMVQTHRGGHIYLRTRVPVRSIKRDPEMQILAQGCYALAPGAEHPGGGTYEFIKHSPRVMELSTLEPLPGVILEPQRIRPTGMPRRAWKLLTGQPVGREYASDSEREYAAICAMVNAGMDLPRIHNAFMRLSEKTSHFGRWMTERGVHSANAMLERMYRKALAFTAHDSVERRLAKATRAYLLDHPLSGRTGVYDQLALDCVLQVALRAGSLSVAVSVRDLAEDTGISKDAAGKALRRLVERGWLQLESEWSGPFSNIYRIQPPKTELQNLYTSTSETNVRKCIGFATDPNFSGHDAFRRGALSKSAAQIWEWLARLPLTQAELVQRTGRNKSTVSRVLDVFQTLQMIEPHDLRGREIVWGTRAGIDLNAIAQFYETSGKHAAQQRKHNDERARYRQQLAASELRAEPEE